MAVGSRFLCRSPVKPRPARVQTPYRARPNIVQVQARPCFAFMQRPACLPACLPFSGPSLLLCCPVCLSSQQHTFKLRAHDERDLCSSSSSSDENLSSLARLQSVQARTGLLSDTGRRLVQTPSRTHQPRKLFQRRAYRRRRLSARRHIATTCRPFFFLRPVASAAAALPPCLSVSSAAHVQTPCTR